MSGMDNEVWNTRERPVSNDHNDAQSLTHRSVLEMVRHMFNLRSFSLGLSVFEVPRNVILGGLVVSPSGNNVSVGFGALTQESATLVPTPSTIDSDYRVGVQLGAVTVTAPAPGSDTWYLLEAQMTEVTTVSESRDILDVPTATFVPDSVPKQRERQIQYQFIAGTTTNAPVPSGGDWVPIAIVFRPLGGGAVLAAHLIDARIMWDADNPIRDLFFSGVLAIRGSRFLITSSIPGTPSNSVIINAEAYGTPARLWYARSGGVDVTAAGILSPGVSLSADTWYYLYLAPWQGIPVVDPRDASATGRGFLVLSDIAPGFQGGARNAAIPLPPPFGITDLTVNHGVCVASLRRNSANTGWLTQWNVGSDAMRIEPIEAHTALALAVDTGTTVTLAGDIPVTAKTVIIQVDQVGGSVDDGSGSTMLVEARFNPVGSASFYRNRTLDRRAGFSALEFELPVALVQSFDFRWSWIAAPIGITDPDFSFKVVGWTE